MWIEINHLNLELYSSTLTKRTKADVAEPPPAAPAVLAPVPEIEKSASAAEISLQLQKFQQKIIDVPVVNESKVNALKQQIQDRTYGILHSNVDIVKETTLRMADKMLNLEDDLFGNNTAKE